MLLKEGRVGQCSVEASGHAAVSVGCEFKPWGLGDGLLCLVTGVTASKNVVVLREAAIQPVRQGGSGPET